MRKLGLMPGVIIYLMACTICSSQVPGNHRLEFQLNDLEGHGRFKDAAETLKRVLSDQTISAAERRKWEFELDRLARIRHDYPLTKDELFAALKKAVKNLTREEFEQWIAEDRFDSREFDGERRFMSSSVSNLFFRHTELNARRIPPKDTAKHDKAVLENVTAIKQAALAEKRPYVLPKRFRATMTVTAKAGAAPDGEIIRAWLPIPRQYPFQTDFELQIASPAVKMANDRNCPIRAAYLERPARKNKPTEFMIQYDYTTCGVWFDVKPNEVNPVDSDDAALRPFIAEAPHVVFTPEIRELSRQIAGGETNSYVKAKKFYDWIAGNIKYSYATEYSTIRNISDYCRARGYGDCGQEALLFITLCRLNGIPARWQSGWNTFPGAKSIHDWCEIYLAPYGWMPVDPYKGIWAMRYAFTLTPAQQQEVRDFYFGGLDQYRMAANSDHNRELNPPKKFMRSDDVDFQRGELEWGEHNIYFDQYTYELQVKELKLPDRMCKLAKPGTARADRRRVVSGLGTWLIVAGLTSPAAPSALAASPQVVRAAESHLQIGVDKKSGRLVELIDRASHHNFAGFTTNLGALWEFDLGDVGTLTPATARVCEVTSLTEKPSGFRFEWREFGLVRAPGLSVEAVARLDDRRALSRWQISLHNLNGQMPRLIRFPRLLGVPEQPGERLAVPAWLGQQAETPRALLRGLDGNLKRLTWSYPGLLSLQCLALTGDRAGLYAACDDTADYLKDFAVFGSSNGGFNFEILHRPESDGSARDHYTLPYSVVLGTFHGDWFDAAALYRSWATNQSWARESRLKRGLVPSWVTNTALWVWNRGPSPGVLDPAIALQKELGLPVSVFWHWWHGCAYDAGFPEYLPPREGEASFKAALQRAHAQDVHAIVYMNQRLWGMTTASWTEENAARFAVKAADGQVKPEIYNTFTKSPCASMCMGTEFWRNKYAGLAASAFGQLGVDGVYMDQACSSLACFDPQHGHAIGGGKYWMGGFQTLAAGIRQRCAARGGPALAGEGCGENWLPYLDLMLSLQVSRERYAGPDGWETIPFFHAVYHGYGVFYGNYSSLTMPPYDELWPAEFAPKEPLKLIDRKFARQFLLEQARAFVWGQQPTLANFRPVQLNDRAEELAYVLRLAKIHARARNYLLRGEMLAPPRVDAPTAALEYSRLSIYAGQQGGLTEFRKVSPLVLATAWRAPNHSVAIAVASLSDLPLTPRLRLDATACGLAGRGKIYRLDEFGRKRIGAYRGKALILKPELAPLDACLLELKPD